MLNVNNVWLFLLQAFQMDQEKMTCLQWEAAVECVNFQIKEAFQIEQCNKIWITLPPILYGVTLQGKYITIIINSSFSFYTL